MAIWNAMATAMQWWVNALFKHTTFPWLNNKQATRLYNKTKDEKNEQIRKQKEYVLYKKALPVAVANSKANDRLNAKKELTYQIQKEQNADKKTQMQLTLKMADYADGLRAAALKKWKDLTSINDNDLIKHRNSTIEGWNKLMADYMNWINEDIFIASGIRDNPAEKKTSKALQVVKNIVWWIGKWSRMVSEWILEAWANKSKKQVDKMIENWLLTKDEWNELKGIYDKTVSWIESQSDIWEDKDSVGYNISKWVTQWVQLAEWAHSIYKGVQSVASKVKFQKILGAEKVLKEAKTWEDIIKNKTLRKIWESIQPKQTPNVIAKEWSRVLRWPNWWSVAWRTNPTLLNKSQNIPNKRDIDKIKLIFESWIDYTTSYTKQANQIAKTIWEKSKQADKLVKNKGTFDNDKIKSTFNSIDEAPSDITDKNKQKIQDIFFKILKKNKNDMEWLHKTKQAFSKDNYINKKLVWADSDMKEYIVEIISKTRWLISKNVNWYDKLMWDETHLYQIIKNVASKETNQSVLAKFYKDNEAIIKAAAYISVLWYGWVEWIKYISGN